jgi:hypothetical protein
VKAQIVGCVCASLMLCAGCSSNDQSRDSDARQAAYVEPGTEQPMAAGDSAGRQMMRGQGEVYLDHPQPDAVPGYSNDVTEFRSGRTRGSSVGFDSASRDNK